MSSCDIASPKNSMMPFEEAMSLMFNNINTLPSVESISLTMSLGRILAADITSPVNMPPFDNSAMDGYALRSDDLKNSMSLTLVGTAFAGTPYELAVESGNCIRIMTGAQLPQGCDSVIMQELVDVDGSKITMNSAVSKGNNIRHCGSEFSLGDTVLKQGEVISARHIALIASLGLKTIEVFKSLTVGIFSTGDELVELGLPLKAGQIYDSNRFAIIAQLQKMNMNIIDYGVIKDDPQLIKNAFEQASLEADVVITSGGVSVGEADFTKDILQEIGNIDFWKIAMKPGKPMAFGRLSDSLFFGLPGNPVSAMVTFYQLAKPAIQKLSGQTLKESLRLSATLTNNIKKRAGRLEFQRGIASTNLKGELSVSTASSQSSGMVGSMCNANCFIILPQAQENLSVGDNVIVELFDSNLQG